ncbi:MAG: hypothetical protein IJA86_08225 [Clostridia bacterium]|nr:hypothetical protein [Clostridia bacterium]
MKKRIFLLCLCLAMFLSSCANQTHQDEGSSPSESNPIGSQPPENNDVQYIIYSEYGIPIKSNLPSDQIHIESADNKIFSFASRTKIEKPDNIENTRTLNIAGQSYDLDYDRTYRTALYSSDKLKSYAEYIRFKSDHVYADYRVKDGTLLFFLDSDIDKLASGNLTENKAKELAQTTITELYGKNILNDYVFDQVIFTNNQMYVQYSVIYRKYVHGMPTNDDISLSFNMQGKLIAVNSLLLGVYDDAEEHLTKEQIDNAFAYLKSALGDEYNIYSTILTVDSLGDYYLEASATTLIGSPFGDPIPVGIYINIE